MGPENTSLESDVDYYRSLAKRVRQHVLRMTHRAKSAHIGTSFSMVELLAVRPEEHRTIALKYMNEKEDCRLRSQQMTINSDGSVPLCCGTYDKKYSIAPSFLDTDHAELQKIKYEHSLCATCMENGMHFPPERVGEQEEFKIASNRIQDRAIPPELNPTGASFIPRLYRRFRRAFARVKRKAL